jgi:hypothetical protein
MLDVLTRGINVTNVRAIEIVSGKFRRNIALR